jgi:hypothetical protein
MRQLICDRASVMMTAPDAKMSEPMVLAHRRIPKEAMRSFVATVKELLDDGEKAMLALDQLWDEGCKRANLVITLALVVKEVPNGQKRS